MISYLLASNCYGFLFFCFYLVLLRNRSSHTWNRIYLLGNVFLALVLPLVRFDIPGGYIPAVVQTLQAVSLPEVTLTAAPTADVPWYTGWPLLLAGYAMVSMALLLRLGYRMLRLRRFLHRQLWIRREDYHLALNTGLGPASYGHTIIFPGNEVDPDILAHEQAHVRYRHHYDRLLLQLLQCLFFPVVPLHLVSRELGLVHEFEADALAGHDRERYMRTLLSEHLGFHGLALLQPFFRHPLRRRIRMLLRNKGSNNRPAKGVALCGAMLLLFAIVYAQSIRALPMTPSQEESGFQLSTAQAGPVNTLPQTPAAPAKAVPKAGKDLAAKVSSEPRTERSGQDAAQAFYAQQQSIPEATTAEPAVTTAPVSTPPVSNTDNKTFTSVEEMPQPPFDVMKYLTANIRYPQEARKQNLQGRVVLQFVIDKEGNVGNVMLQRDIGGGCGVEAVRVVQNMPKWKPGRQDGQPVRVYYTLPVSFKLEEKTELPPVNK